MAWCKDNDVDHVIGLARNSRLIERIGWELADADTEVERKGRPARRFTEFPYATRTSWSCRRRVVAKGRASGGQGQPALRGHLAACGHLPGPDRLRAPLLRAGQHGEHDQGAAARSLLRVDRPRRARGGCESLRLAGARPGSIEIRSQSAAHLVAVVSHVEETALASTFRAHSRPPGACGTGLSPQK